MAALSGLPCPRCGERGFGRAPGGPQPVVVACSCCGAAFDAVADVTVVADRARRVGGCCAGFHHHQLLWRSSEDAPDGETAFETWTQDCIRFAAGNRATLLFGAGEIALGPVKRPPMPLMVADHTTGQVWALPGCVPVATLRPAAAR